MRLSIWGARGSVPVSGPEYLRYGGDTTCLTIETASGELLIFDAGTGIRALCAITRQHKTSGSCGSHMGKIFREKFGFAICIH